MTTAIDTLRGALDRHDRGLPDRSVGEHDAPNSARGSLREDEDRQLIARVAAQDPRAITMLYQRDAPCLGRFLSKSLKSEARLERIIDSAMDAIIAVDDAGRVLDTVHDVQERQQRLRGLNHYFQDEFRRSHAEGDLIGASQGLRAVMENVHQVAATDASVLLLGETGTGKEMIARAIHASSARKDRALITLNCATIPKDLFESELFGHEKGAFTGALARKLGRFELADKGTLFLDELGELPLDLQAKLLRVLQEWEFERVGGTGARKVDVRILAATNRDLARRARDGSFRADLYYRLNVFPITLPPLRQRKEDLPLLVEHFVRRYAEKYDKSIATIPAHAMNALEAHDWPGNVRELQHVIERAVILTRGAELALDAGILDGAPGGAPSPPPIETLEAAERSHILKALEACGWRVSGKGGAAELLGLRPSTLGFRMKKLGITRPPERSQYVGTLSIC
jgi:formate hydrogenlyase transcriptional activator